MHLFFHFKFADQVFAIAKTMPGLRHLAISGISIGHNELVAILDGCPLLDSLHLQNYVHYHFSQSLDNRLHQQIKDLQLPNLYDKHVVRPTREKKQSVWLKDFITS